MRLTPGLQCIVLCLQMACGLAMAQPAAQSVVVHGPVADAAALSRASTVEMEVLGRAELDAYGDTDLVQVLQRHPGIDVDDERPALQGRGGEAMQVLINGLPAMSGFSLSSLAPGDVERVEIVKGATAQAGGGAGTLNIVLRAPPRQRQLELRAAWSYRGAEPEASASLSWGQRDKSSSLQLPLRVFSNALAVDHSVWRDARSPAGLVSQQQVLAHDLTRSEGLSLAPAGQWSPGARDGLQWQLLAQANDTHTTSHRETWAITGPAPSMVHEQTLSDSAYRLLRA